MLARQELASEAQELRLQQHPAGPVDGVIQAPASLRAAADRPLFLLHRADVDLVSPAMPDQGGMKNLLASLAPLTSPLSCMPSFRGSSSWGSLQQEGAGCLWQKSRAMLASRKYLTIDRHAAATTLCPSSGTD